MYTILSRETDKNLKVNCLRTLQEHLDVNFHFDTESQKSSSCLLVFFQDK